MTIARRVTVVGAGSWGTALADHLARIGHDVVIWALEPEVVEGIDREARNPLFLSDVRLAASLRATGDLARALHGAELVLSAVPTPYVRAVLGGSTGEIGDVPVVSVSKGIDVDTLLTPSGVLAEIGIRDDRIVALSGPSFARDVAAGLPTAVVTAAPDADLARAVRDLFSAGRFRAYSSDDRIGVELGGALKNVVAIAAGIADGLGVGDNARAAVITRGLAEITRLGVDLGGDPLTFAGLSGVGDLVLTCTGTQSRNHQVGAALGRGTPAAEVLAGMREVAEGVRTSASARRLARARGVDMPITEQVAAVIHEGRDPHAALETLLARRPRDEREPRTIKEPLA